MGKLIDMTGKRFGSLVVIKRDPQPHVKPYWICKCDCGREISVYGTNLRNGKTTQCKFCGSTQGAYKRYKELYDSLPGKKFNYITVLKEDSSKPSGEGLPKQWLCKCDCGKIMSLSTHNILSEKMMSCGCIKNSKGEELLSQIFSANNIIFETQKTFETCRFPITKALAKFDFYLPEDNIFPPPPVFHIARKDCPYQQAAVHNPKISCSGFLRSSLMLPDNVSRQPSDHRSSAEMPRNSVST